MISRLAFALAAAMTVTGAQAADLTRKPAAAVVAAPVLSWTGFFAGVQLGGQFGGRTYMDNIGHDAGLNSINGVLFGLQGGYNFQADRVVYGLAADVSYSTAEQTVTGTAATAAYLTPGATATMNLAWLATARARLGYLVMPDVLVYGTAGLAFGSTRYRTNVPSDISATSLGWTAGLGAEYALNTRWTTSLEYRYHALGAIAPGAWSNVSAGTTIVGLVYPTSHTLRLGVNYRF